MRERLDLSLDIEYTRLNKDTTRLWRWLQGKIIQSEYFDLTRFNCKMLRLKSLLIKQVSFSLIPTSQYIVHLLCILQLLCSCIVLVKDLANEGYNKNTKKKEKIAYIKWCVCHEKIDGNILSLKQLSCGHLFHAKCILEWFNNL